MAVRGVSVEFGSIRSGADACQRDTDLSASAHACRKLTVGSSIMENTDFGGDKPVLFYCGDDAGAKETVKALAQELAFDAVDAGPLKEARLLEPFALLWITLALKQGHGRQIAFKFMHR